MHCGPDSHADGSTTEEEEGDRDGEEDSELVPKPNQHNASPPPFAVLSFKWIHMQLYSTHKQPYLTAYRNLVSTLEAITHAFSSSTRATAPGTSLSTFAATPIAKRNKQEEQSASKKRQKTTISGTAREQMHTTCQQLFSNWLAFATLAHNQWSSAKITKPDCLNSVVSFFFGDFELLL